MLSDNEVLLNRTFRTSYIDVSQSHHLLTANRPHAR